MAPAVISGRFGGVRAVKLIISVRFEVARLKWIRKRQFAVLMTSCMYGVLNEFLSLSMGNGPWCCVPIKVPMHYEDTLHNLYCII